MRIKTRALSSIIFVATLYFSALVSADGNSVDKVYHPYVLPLETEIEWRVVSQHDEDSALDNQQTYRFGVGYSPIENWFTEIYLIGENSSTEEFEVNAVEIEAKVQLSEQGELEVDWGLLFELERNFEQNTTELAAALLMEKEWGRWVGAANVFIEFEERENLRNEIETILAMQLRYRYDRLFEPALELYQNQDTLALGPAIMGNVRLGIAKKIHWEFGVILGLEKDTPDQTVRALVEYEF